MADNVPITAGTGTTIATDDVAGVHYQQVKLVDGTANSTTGIPGDATNGLDVDVTRVPAPLSLVGGGVEAAAMRVTIANDSTGVLSVDDNGGSLTVDNAGTFVVQVNGAALTSLQLIDDVIYVDDADWTDDTSKHMLVGGVYQATPHTVTDGDVTPFLTDANGRLVVAAHAVTNAGTFVVQVNGDALTRLTDIETNTDSGAVVGNGAAATAQRVTIANDSTGIIALTTSTASIGKLAANSGVDIGDVDITSVVPGTNATNLGKAEDGAHTTGDVGVMALGVRNDADATLAGTDGDYTPLSVDAAGNQNVKTRYDLVRVSVQSSGLTTSVTAYTAGDQMGDQFTVANASRASGGTGMIRGVVLISAATNIGACDVVFTRASATLAGDNAAYAISDADALNVVGLVQLAGAFSFGNNRICQAFNLAIPYDCSGGTSLFAGIITRVGHTFFGAATDLQLIVFLERN